MADDERVKLRILLKHWIEHNKEHGQEFREWAGKAKAFGDSEAAEEMLRAAQAMNRASEALAQALSRLS